MYVRYDSRFIEIDTAVFWCCLCAILFCSFVVFSDCNCSVRDFESYQGKVFLEEQLFCTNKFYPNTKSKPDKVGDLWRKREQVTEVKARSV